MNSSFHFPFRPASFFTWTMVVACYLAIVLSPLQSFILNDNITIVRILQKLPITNRINFSQQNNLGYLCFFIPSLTILWPARLGLVILICLYFPNHTRLFPISLSALPFFFTMLIPTLFQEVFPWSPSWLIIPSPILPGNPVHSTSQPLLYYIKMFPSENQYSKSSAVADFCFSLRDQIYVTSQKGHLWSSHTPTWFTLFFLSLITSWYFLVYLSVCV